MSNVTIYHNPACGTSRNTLALIRNSGEEPQVIEYLKTPPTREELKGLIQRMGVSVRDVLRQKGTPYAELGLGDPSLTDDQLLDAMMAHPILINRPFVVGPRGTRLARKSSSAPWFSFSGVAARLNSTAVTAMPASFSAVSRSASFGSTPYATGGSSCTRACPPSAAAAMRAPTSMR